MEWGIHFNIAQKEDRIFTLDVQDETLHLG